METTHIGYRTIDRPMTPENIQKFTGEQPIEKKCRICIDDQQDELYYFCPISRVMYRAKDGYEIRT
jgi:hypothetical protein